MYQHVHMVRRDATPPLPQDTAATGTIERAPDYRELRLQDGTSVFIPTSDESVPTD